MKRKIEPELMVDFNQVRAFQQSNKNYYLPILLDLYQKFGGISQGRVVDLGCGTGDFDILLSEQFSELTIKGYDGSDAMIDIAQTNSNSKINFKCRTFNLINDSADLVISTNTLHHIHNPQVFWSAIKSISSNVFVVDLVRPESEKQAKEIVEYFSSTEDEYYKEDFYNSLLASFTVKEIQDQIKNSNLKLDIVGDPTLAQLAIIYSGT